MEEQVVQTAERIQLEPPEEPLRVALRRDRDELEAACAGAALEEDGSVFGCAGGLGDGAWVETVPHGFGHEVVHGLRRQQSLVGPMWFEEGVAGWAGWGAFDPEQTVVASTLDTPVLALESFEEYRAALHYFAWLSETQGLPNVADFMNGPEFVFPADEADVLALFEERFGVSLEESYAAYISDAPGELRSSSFCGEGEAPPLENVTMVVGYFDCGSSGTFGYGYAESINLGRSCVVARAEAEYEVLLSGPEGATLELRGIGCDQSLLERFEVGVPRSVLLQACDWSVWVEAPRGAEGEASVLFTRL